MLIQQRPWTIIDNTKFHSLFDKNEVIAELKFISPFLILFLIAWDKLAHEHHAHPFDKFYPSGFLTFEFIKRKLDDEPVFFGLFKYFLKL